MRYTVTEAEYVIKDSGERQKFEGGGVRDTEEGKLDWSNLFVWFEPMATRYVTHMTNGRLKYPDPVPGVPNWTLFPDTPEVLARTLRSLDRHYKAYRAGETDEDHAAGILFNLNAAERIRERMADAERNRTSPGRGPGPDLGMDANSVPVSESRSDIARKRDTIRFEGRDVSPGEC